MKSVLFFVKSTQFLRYHKSFVLALLGKGFKVVVVLDRAKKKYLSESLDRFVKKNLGISVEWGSRRLDWRRLAIPLRNLRNYCFVLRHSTSKFRISQKENYLPRLFQGVIDKFPILSRLILSRRIIDNYLAFLETLVPIDQVITEKLRRLRPAAVIVSYRNYPCSCPDIDYIKSAKHLGIPVVLLDPSWDTLSVKTMIQVVPDKLFVWNQKHGVIAHEWHMLPNDRIEVVGATQLDPWFDTRRPIITREQYAELFGHNLAPRFLFYLGSSLGGEADCNSLKCLSSWLLNSPIPELNKIQIILRPYPGKENNFKKFSAQNVSLFPTSSSKLDLDEDADLYNSIYYALAVVAVNTTAIIEAMAVGRPVLLMVQDVNSYEFQMEDYFSDIIKSNAVYTINNSHSLESVVGDLLVGKDPCKESRDRFLMETVRPQGINFNVGEIIARKVCVMIEEKSK